MKKLINKPDMFVSDFLEGILRAHGDVLGTAGNDTRAIVKKDVPAGKVAIVTGGGSGHLPLFLGYVGKGLADACAVGNVFASPSAKVMYDAAKATERGAGVLFLFGNYGGDRMNFELASEDLEDDGIQVRRVICNDDIASASEAEKQKRRGIAGIMFAYKIAGAAAEKMLPLDEVARLAEKARDNTRTMGVALSACTLPEVGTPSFEIAEDEMEIGMGIHGEPGIRRGKLQEADAVAEDLCSPILKELDIKAGDEVAVLVNGLGATPKEELYIVYRKVDEILQGVGAKIDYKLIGEYSTSMEMAGMSVSMMKLDEELKELLHKEAVSPFMVL